MEYQTGYLKTKQLHHVSGQASNQIYPNKGYLKLNPSFQVASL
ncbi:MAG: hypothetical protein ACFNQI_04380 [Eikenella corrodens]|jgi:hypothetical protein